MVRSYTAPASVYSSASDLVVEVINDGPTRVVRVGRPTNVSHAKASAELPSLEGAQHSAAAGAGTSELLDELTADAAQAEADASVGKLLISCLEREIAVETSRVVRFALMAMGESASSDGPSPLPSDEYATRAPQQQRADVTVPSTTPGGAAAAAAAADAAPDVVCIPAGSVLQEGDLDAAAAAAAGASPSAQLRGSNGSGADNNSDDMDTYWVQVVSGVNLPPSDPNGYSDP